MAVRHVKPQSSVDALLQAATQLSTPELEQLSDKIRVLADQRKAGDPANREAELLQRISKTFPPAFYARLDELIAHRREEILTDQEQAELIQMLDQVESWDVERLEYLVELADIRKTTLSALIQSLGLRPRPHD